MNLRPRVLDVYLARTVMVSALLAGAVLLGFDLISALFNELDEVGEGGYTLSHALLYTAYTAPRRMYELFPTVALIGCVLGLGGLASRSELTAMRAVGQRRGGDLALANPWFFPAPQVYRALLERHGFSVKRVALIPRPVVLKTGIEGWLMLFRKPFFVQFGESAQQALADTVDLLRSALCDADGNWTADYVRLRVEAVKA